MLFQVPSNLNEVVVRKVGFFLDLCSLAQIHTDESHRGRVMSFFGLIATAIGAPWIVAVCGFLTITLIAYAALFRCPLRESKPVGDA